LAKELAEAGREIKDLFFFSPPPSPSFAGVDREAMGLTKGRAMCHKILGLFSSKPLGKKR
jgi:hypothetical protein